MVILKAANLIWMNKPSDLSYVPGSCVCGQFGEVIIPIESKLSTFCQEC